MRKSYLPTAFSLSIMFLACSFFVQGQETLKARSLGERFAIKSTSQIIAAEFTYMALEGSGNFATLDRLPYIDSQLASGDKYGYHFSVSTTPYSAGAPASFQVTATPIRYPKTGRRSFFADSTGELHGADKNGSVATANDPYIDSCSLFGLIDNERCTVGELRTLHGAEMTYAATYGASAYGSLPQLGNSLLIAPRLATGNIHGYSFSVTISPQTSESTATFRISATPATYGVTGNLSFFIGTDGVIYAADKHGLAADEDDPVLEN